VRHFAVSVVGKDRPGIAAAVSEVLLLHRGNIEDSQMTILRGHFTIMLIVSTPENVDPANLEEDLVAVRERLDLEAVVVNEVTEIEPSADPAATHIVSVYGVDHPGIVHAVTSSLAKQQVNITDLTTRLVSPHGGEPLYAMMLEVVLPPGVSAEKIEESLREVREREGVELTIRELEQDAL
jgi:glycine cleavage system transcriptional repressor